MKLYIAGGCKEHGRNCFFIENKGKGILLDCGKMRGEETKYPQLSTEQIKKARYLFLTHSHTAHAGALDWLYLNGFHGKVILSMETFTQLKEKPKEYLILTPKSRRMLVLGIYVRCGRSGHCEGALWYLITWNRKHIFFSGDYCEVSDVYPCDKVRNVTADIAMVDCAYGDDQVSAIQSKEQLLKEITQNLCKKKRDVLLPVPKFGRGIEIMQDLLQEPDIPMVVEQELISQYQKNTTLKRFKEVMAVTQPYAERMLQGPNVYVICDPQLKKVENRRFATDLLIKHGKIFFTGNIEKGSYSEMLYQCGAGSLQRYDAHQNLKEARALVEQNRFERVVLTQCKGDITNQIGQSPYMNMKNGEEMLF